jgi:hypothetical protein
VIRKPTVEVEMFHLVETECLFQEARQICTAPPHYKCTYRKVKVLAQ